MHWKPLHQTYAEYMHNHPYGTAAYRPLPYRDFHPGSVGYFDSNGEWNPITDLSAPSTLTNGHFTPIQDLQRAPSDARIEWGPKASKNIKSHKAAFSAGVSPAIATVLPGNVSAHLTYSNSTAGGALLLTAPPITRERYHHETPFKRWVHDNTVELVRQRSEVLEYGMWIVLSTYATSDCAIHVWDEAGKNIDVGFDVSVDVIGELGPAGGWKLDRAGGGWERYTSSKDEQGRVVFFGGLFFRPRRVPIGGYLKPQPRTVASPKRRAVPFSAPKSAALEVLQPAKEAPPYTETVDVPEIALPEMDMNMETDMEISMECEEVLDRGDSL